VLLVLAVRSQSSALEVAGLPSLVEASVLTVASSAAEAVHWGGAQVACASGPLAAHASIVVLLALAELEAAYTAWGLGHSRP